MDIATAPTACLKCRQRHLKCDFESPECARCVASGTRCIYVQSRRGMLGGRRKKPKIHPARPSEDSSSATTITTTTTLPHGEGLDLEVTSRQERDSLAPIPTSAGSNSLADVAIDAYYQYFHPAHPFLIPYDEYNRDRSIMPDFLSLCVQFAGSHYCSFSASDQAAQARLILDPDLPENGFRVQGLLIMTITSYARFERELGDQAILLAIDIALRLGMGTEDFGAEETSLWRESWKRTWWQLFVILTMISLVSGIQRKIPIDLMRSLPINEDDYEKCLDVESRTFQQMLSRYYTEEEFAWSSFAYTIEAAYLLNQVLDLAETQIYPSEFKAKTMDASITAFLLSLPLNRRTVVKINGDVDETMSYALLLINLAGIRLHFPQSDLAHLLDMPTVCGTNNAQSFPDDPGAYLYHASVAIACANSISELIMGRRSVATTSPCFVCGISLAATTQLAALYTEQESALKDLLKHNVQLAFTALKEIGEKWQVGNIVKQQLMVYAQDAFQR